MSFLYITAFYFTTSPRFFGDFCSESAAEFHFSRFLPATMKISKKEGYQHADY